MQIIFAAAASELMKRERELRLDNFTNYAPRAVVLYFEYCYEPVSERNVDQMGKVELDRSNDLDRCLPVLVDFWSENGRRFSD